MRRRIVLVEDDEDIRDLVSTVLSAAGYEVVSTGLPQDAHELVRAQQPELVLCDIAMPVMDGYAVVRALQSDPVTAQHPIVFLTARREFTERVRAFRHGVVDYLTKPFTPEALVAKVERVLATVDRRAGVVQEEAPAAGDADLLASLRRESRTGLLTVRGPAGDEQVVLRAGEVVEGVPPAGTGGPARFEEMDSARDQMAAAHDPVALPGPPGALPGLPELPEPMRKVVVVEDNPDFRRFLRELLQAQGLVVSEAGEAEEGLRVCLEERPWLIVSDVRLPGRSGLELCRQVRLHSLIRHTPFLFLSGWDGYEERMEGLQAGANDFVSKDTPARELLMRVHLLLRRHAELRGRDRRGSGVAGRLGVVSAPALFQVCHLGSLSGVLTIRDGDQVAIFGFRQGQVVGADAEGAHGAEAVFEALGWTRGSFEFTPGDAGVGTAVDVDFEWLIQEGCRRLDESVRPWGAA